MKGICGQRKEREEEEDLLPEEEEQQDIMSMDIMSMDIMSRKHLPPALQTVLENPEISGKEAAMTVTALSATRTSLRPDAMVQFQMLALVQQ